MGATEPTEILRFFSMSSVISVANSCPHGTEADICNGRLIYWHARTGLKPRAIITKPAKADY